MYFGFDYISKDCSFTKHMPRIVAFTLEKRAIFKFCVENWYYKLHLNDAVQSRIVSKFSEILKKAVFSISLTMDCVIPMKLVIPIFHT